MTEAFSFNREFDFVRLDGLRRATGQPAHEWDIYIIKELIDNALDADESLWSKNLQHFPSVQIDIEYIPIQELKSQQVYIKVSNRNIFPVHLIQDIFSTQWYTSRKAFLKGLSRGALGNALKTLLGIPYALRHRVASDWNPELKPMSILCNEKEYLPRFLVDSTAQNIKCECEEKSGKSIEGTVISIGLDNFLQENPRTLKEIKILAEQYHICNPHVQFNWTVEIGEQEWEQEYVANYQWSNKFKEIAPIQWYQLDAFQNLLNALYRQEKQDLSVVQICDIFAGLRADKTRQIQVSNIINEFGQEKLSQFELEGQVTIRLYKLLSSYSPSFKSDQLGFLGKEYIQMKLTEILPIEGEIFYEKTTDVGDDPNIPFVIEVAVAALKKSEIQDNKRLVYTSVNFSPTYADPFQRRWLQLPSQTDQNVLGLRGFLEAYGLSEEAPIIFFLHLVCPNVEHNEFSKTDINHLPFKQVLGQVLEKLLHAYGQAQEEEKLKLEKIIFQAIDTILKELEPNEQFAVGQLLEKLQVKLKQNSSLVTWLNQTDTVNRLQTYLNRYQSQNDVLTYHVARSTVSTLAIPLHPDGYFTVSAERLPSLSLKQHHVNKILYVQVRELEPVILENGWLCRMDLALLQNPPTTNELKEVLIKCINNCDLPILILHNVDEGEKAIAKQIDRWLKEKHLDTNRIIDLGLYSPKNSNQPRKLMEMMPGEISHWLLNQFENFSISTKSIPIDADLCQGISKQFEQLLLGHLWEGISQKLQMSHFLFNLDRQLNFTQMMKEQQLDEQIKQALQKDSCKKSYTVVLGETVKVFYQNFMVQNNEKVQNLVQEHLKQVIDE
jgi:DNA topoisomerase VI subunit B